MKTEHVNCNVCNEDNTIQIFEARDMLLTHEKFNVVKCLNCGLVYISPRPMIDEILRYYTDEYEPHSSKENNMRNLSLNIYNKLFGYPFLELEHFNFGRILDVGCGSGKLLDMLNKRGLETFGTDISSNAIKSAREKGLNVFKGELHDIDFHQEFFDIIIMRHSLEHMYDPKKEIEIAYNILKYDGILMIEVPNIDCLESKLFRKYWFQIDAPRHLYHFNKKTISRLLKDAHFDIVDITQLAIPFSTVSQSINYMTGFKFKKFFQMSLGNLLFYPISILEANILHQGPSILVRSIKR